MKIIRKLFALPKPAVIKRWGKIEARRAMKAAKNIELKKGHYDKAMKIKDTYDDTVDNYNRVMNEKEKGFSGREKVPAKILKKAKEDGVIQRDGNGDWRIISMKSGEYWNAKYSSREKAESALSAYHANKH